MRIDGINKINQAYKINSTKKVEKAKKVNNDKDSLAISDHARELQIAKKAVKNAPDVRMDKVNDIKKRLESGTYNVSAEEVADKIVDNYFDKKI